MMRIRKTKTKAIRHTKYQGFKNALTTTGLAMLALGAVTGTTLSTVWHWLGCGTFFVVLGCKVMNRFDILSNFLILIKKGFSRSNLQNMRAFFLAYPNCQTLSGKLSWSHYCELLIISDPDRRSFYEKECERSGWSVREMKRQIATSLFERLLLSNGKANKEKVYELAAKGQELAAAEDIVKDPYVFEFLGIPENKPVLESELEKALVRQIENFMLELGRGFMFVGTQQRVREDE